MAFVYYASNVRACVYYERGMKYSSFLLLPFLLRLALKRESSKKSIKTKNTPIYARSGQGL